MLIADKVELRKMAFNYTQRANSPVAAGYGDEHFALELDNADLDGLLALRAQVLSPNEFSIALILAVDKYPDGKEQQSVIFLPLKDGKIFPKGTNEVYAYQKLEPTKAAVKSENIVKDNTTQLAMNAFLLKHFGL
jgi:hypothetical protein